MNEQVLLELGRDTLTLVAMMAGPLLLVAMTVGLMMNILQTITSLQEQTLTFVPKVGAVLAATLLLMPWLLQTLSAYTARLLNDLQRFIA